MNHTLLLTGLLIAAVFFLLGMYASYLIEQRREKDIEVPTRWPGHRDPNPRSRIDMDEHDPQYWMTDQKRMED